MKILQYMIMLLCAVTLASFSTSCRQDTADDAEDTAEETAEKAADETDGVDMGEADVIEYEAP